ncbi:hypothetical protein [Streptomyces sp. CAU 1734]|uniref:hypothetical protein n=1 Tax=Streptomyces sp. CAU 1734 TaxID=3140360 RepID=UPI0032615A65
MLKHRNADQSWAASAAPPPATASATLQDLGNIALRVHERGTCGTGAIAAVCNADRTAATDSYLVDTPGCRFRIAVLPDDTMYLTGPAAMVAQGTVHLTTFTVDMDTSITVAA